MERRLTLYAPWLLMAMPVIATVHSAVAIPVSYDEAWTFLNFTRKDFPAFLAHYPAPNNHVLHSLLTKFADALPGFPHLFKIRLFPLLWYTLGLWMTWRIVRRYFGEKTALAVMALSGVLFMTLYYGYMSRGYGLSYLLFVCSFGETLAILKGNAKARHFMVLGIWSVLGFYTIPSYLYAYLTLQAIILFLRPERWKVQFAVAAATAAAVCLLYLPILCNDGIQSVVANRFVAPIGLVETLRSLPAFFAATMREIMGVGRGIALALTALSAGALLWSRDRKLIGIGLLAIAVPATVLLLQRTIPFPRTFHYVAFLLVFLPMAAWSPKMEKLSLKVLLPLLLLVQAGLLWHFKAGIADYEDRDMAQNTTASKIIPEMLGDHRYLFNGSLLDAQLEFMLIEKGYKNYSIVRKPITDADTAFAAGYDYVIIENGQDTTKRQPWSKNGFYAVYRSKAVR